MQRWLLHHIADSASARAWLAKQDAGWAAGTRYSLAIVEAADPAADPTAADEVDPVGLLSARRLASDASSIEFGYWIAAHARGRALASRALVAAVDWVSASANASASASASVSGLSASPVRRLELSHSIGNLASCRVAHKAGFTLEQELPANPPRYPSVGHLHTRSL